MNLQNAIGEVHPDGSLDVVASGAPAGLPLERRVRNGARGRTKLYGVNFSISELFGLPSGSGPGVFWLDAGVPGMPVP